MRILLINPPCSDKNLINKYSDGADVGRYNPVGAPHALCSLAGNLKEHEVEIVDFKAEYRLGLNIPVEEAVRRKISAFNPDVVGVTVLTSEYPSAMKIFETVKNQDPAILTVAGGVHVTLCPQDFERPAIDIAVMGHGKYIFKRIVECARKKEGFSEIPNISVNRGGTFYYTKNQNLFQCPEKLLSDVCADRSLVRKYIDAYRVGPHGDALGSVETSYGCPNKCTFCSIWPMNKGHYHERAVEHIVEELKMLQEYKVVRFIDANTMGSTEHINRVMDRIIRENFNYYFMMDIRSDTAAYREDLVKKAAEMGVVIAIVGLESVEEEELKHYNKEATLYENLKAIEMFHKYNINMRANFLIQPGYTEKNFRRIKEFVLSNDLKYSVFTIMTPFPGTPLYEEVKDKITITDLSYYNLLNSVLPTTLPEEEFYRQVADLYSGQVIVR